jgi:hypothetical protein
LRDRYTVFTAQAIERYKASLPPEALAELESQIRAQVNDGRGQAYTVDMMVQRQMDKALSKRLSLPSFEEWKAHQATKQRMGLERKR